MSRNATMGKKIERTGEWKAQFERFWEKHRWCRNPACGKMIEEEDWEIGIRACSKECAIEINIAREMRMTMAAAIGAEERQS